MKEINIKLETKDDNFDTCTFLNLFISYIGSNAAKQFQCNYMGYEEKVKPTLTEDERVILKLIKSSENYKTYKKIGRTTYGSLYLAYDLNKETARELGELETDITEFDMYNDLFQFIKERRRI